jgi:hypothetical protein
MAAVADELRVMLVATFGPTTAWAGKQVTWDGAAFVLEGHGPIAAADVMEYDRQGHLLWMNDGTRAWVGSRAVAPRASRPARLAAIVAAVPAAVAKKPRPEGSSQPAESHAVAKLKRVLLVAIVALCAVNVVLLLVAVGILPSP